jgi:hypothetical protein
MLWAGKMLVLITVLTDAHGAPIIKLNFLISVILMFTGTNALQKCT